MARGARQAAKPLSPLAAEAAFEREIGVFRTEAESAAQFFYAFLAIHAAVAAKRPVLNHINTAPLFWKTMLGALQTASFAALGRVFDEKSTHNVGTLLRLAQNHPQIFSRAALARRNQGSAATPLAWLGSYTKSVYEPKPADFRHLCGYVSKHRKIYADKYRPLRHQVFAHKGLSDARGGVGAVRAHLSMRPSAI